MAVVVSHRGYVVDCLLWLCWRFLRFSGESILGLPCLARRRVLANPRTWWNCDCRPRQLLLAVPWCTPAGTTRVSLNAKSGSRIAGTYIVSPATSMGFGQAFRAINPSPWAWKMGYGCCRSCSGKMKTGHALTAEYLE